ncbi:MAG: DegV family protein [Lachnospiraceae bacterium]|nr:DegV family protein [Lachnospiraceae bacterium]
MDPNNDIQIIIDSTTNIREEYRNLVLSVPLTVTFGEKEYLDDVNLSLNEFYEKLENENILPTTSQPSPAAFEKIYEEVRNQGKAAIVITLSAKLSGTYQSACIAAQSYPEVTVIDSGNVTIGAGILIEHAIQCVQKGMSKDKLVEELIKKREDICIIALLDTLEYLMKGGRISKASAIAGTALNIKPVITVKDGVISVLGKARGSHKANNLLVEHVKKMGVDYDAPVLLGYSGTSRELLDNYINDNTELWTDRLERLNTTQICSVIGTHAGPGAIAVAFFKNNT